MPFEIGKVFSPEMLSLVLRKQEDEKNRGLEVARLSLQARGQARAEDQAKRELMLQRDRLFADQEDSKLKRQLALADDDRANKSLSLSQQRAQFGDALEQRKTESDIGSRNRQLDLGELEYSAQQDDRDRNFKLRERGQDASESQAEWERDVQHPDRMSVEAMKDDTRRTGLSNSKAIQERRLAIAETKAQQLLGGNRGFGGATKVYEGLIKAYNSVVEAAANGLATQEQVDQAAADLAAYQKTLLERDSETYRAVNTSTDLNKQAHKITQKHGLSGMSTTTAEDPLDLYTKVPSVPGSR